ncbi:MAG: penicillin-binding protein 2 [Candidatus Delongbacteria bacterium]
MNVSRTKLFFKLSVFLFIIAIFRILYLQYFDPRLAKRSIQNRIRTTDIEPSRGRIMDRNGKLIIDNQYSYSLYVIPQYFTASEYTTDFISEILRIDKDSMIFELTSANVFQDRFYRLMKNIDLSVYSGIAEKENMLRGVYVKKEWMRKFVVECAPHLIGYLGEAREPGELAKDIKYGDLIGKEGVEYIYDDILRGEKGYIKELKDVKGNKVSDFKKDKWKNAVKGKDVYLTIDVELQLFAEDLLKNRSGTIIVQDCSNGEILALASKPDYTLDIFSGKLSQKEWKRWFEDPAKPLYNKAIMGLYPPGSVIKMGTVIAASEQGLKEPEDITHCPGGMQIGNRFIKCWLHSGHGNVDMKDALTMSCDTYFYDIALSVDIDKWKTTMEKFGFGNKTGIDLKYERIGLVPGKEYYTRRIRGDLTGRYANLMIGQGEFLVTPIQISNFTCMIANGGKKFTPHIMHKYGEGDDMTGYENSPEYIGFDKDMLSLVRKAMHDVVNSPNGTAYRARSSKIIFAGKTGTAQNPHGEDHAWFNAFGPYKDPEIAVTVFEEHGIGGSLAAFLAREVFEYWHEKNLDAQ